MHLGRVGQPAAADQAGKASPGNPAVRQAGRMDPVEDSNRAARIEAPVSVEVSAAVRRRQHQASADAESLDDFTSHSA